MSRVFQNRLRVRLFDQLTGVKNPDAVGQVGVYADVMRDQHQRAAFFLLHVLQHLDDAALHDDVQRRGRLIGEDDLGQRIVARAMVTRWRMPPDS